MARRTWMNVAWIALVAAGVADWLVINLVVGPGAAAAQVVEGSPRAPEAAPAPPRPPQRSVYAASSASETPSAPPPAAPVSAASAVPSAAPPASAETANAGTPPRSTEAAAKPTAANTSSISFAKQSAALTQEATLVLRGAAKALEADPERTILLVGHADDRGPKELNQWLSNQRALSARDYLVHLGVDVRRVEAIGVGSEQPADAAQTEDALARNRRVDVTLR